VVAVHTERSRAGSASIPWGLMRRLLYSGHSNAGSASIPWGLRRMLLPWKLGGHACSASTPLGLMLMLLLGTLSTVARAAPWCGRNLGSFRPREIVSGGEEGSEEGDGLLAGLRGPCSIQWPMRTSRVVR